MSWVGVIIPTARRKLILSFTLYWLEQKCSPRKKNSFLFAGMAFCAWAWRFWLGFGMGSLSRGLEDRWPLDIAMKVDGGKGEMDR